LNYLDALRLIHATVKPQFYVEIGCREGASLELAQCPRLAIDPEPNIKAPLSWPTRLFCETSDAFFARPAVHTILGQAPDLAFIDGMHLVEYALRDFINIEAHANRDTVIVIDDVAPGDIAWASRDRETQAWTGDVYKLIPLLRHYRPDLEIAVFDATILTFGKGLAVISNLDPRSTVLQDRYDEILEKLENGTFTEQTTQGIRNQLQVRPSSALTEHITPLARQNEASTATASPTKRYLDLMKKTLLNELCREDEYRLYYLRSCLEGETEFDRTAYLDLKGHNPDEFTQFSKACDLGRPFGDKISNLGFTHTMMGRARLDSLHHCLDLIRENRIPGDVIECGVWRGGGCIFMAAYLEVHGLNDRKLLVADSFEGLPTPRDENDAGLDLSKEKFPELAVSLEKVQENFAAYDLLDDSVTFLKGWFCDTLTSAPTDQIALLRLDGDLYSSTMDALVALYNKVPEGGVIIVDDFSLIKSCEQAVRDFFAARNEAFPDIEKIDWTGVYWIKRTIKLEDQ
jgi:predicted O-methyltransferase YrrM